MPCAEEGCLARLGLGLPYLDHVSSLVGLARLAHPALEFAPS